MSQTVCDCAADHLTTNYHLRRVLGLFSPHIHLRTPLESVRDLTNHMIRLVLTHMHCRRFMHTTWLGKKIVDFLWNDIIEKSVSVFLYSHASVKPDFNPSVQGRRHPQGQSAAPYHLALLESPGHRRSGAPSEQVPRPRSGREDRSDLSCACRSIRRRRLFGRAGGR